MMATIESDDDSSGSGRATAPMPDFQVNKVLCFLQQRSTTISFDHLVKICSDYFSLGEIDTARTRLSNFVSNKRLVKPRGSNEEIAARSISTTLKVCLDATVTLPVFCTANLSRIPPVDAEHAILSELSSL